LLPKRSDSAWRSSGLVVFSWVPWPSRPKPAMHAIATTASPSGQAGSVLATTKELYGKHRPSSDQNTPLQTRCGLERSRRTSSPTVRKNAAISQ